MEIVQSRFWIGRIWPKAKKNDMLFFSWFPVPLLVISYSCNMGLSIYECHWWVLLWKTTHFCGFLKLAHLHEDLAHRAASMILRVHLDKMHVDLVSDLALVEGILYESASVGVGVNWSYTYRVIWVRICLVLFEWQYDHNHVSWSSQMSPVTSEVRCWWLLFGSMPVHVSATWIDTTCAYIDSDSVSHNQPFSHGWSNRDSPV